MLDVRCEIRFTIYKDVSRNCFALTPIVDLGIISGEIGNCFSDSFSDSYEMTTIDSFGDFLAY